MGPTDPTNGSENDMTGIPHYSMYIDGRWRDASGSLEVRDPATNRLVATVARATPPRPTRPSPRRRQRMSAVSGD